MHSVRYAFIFYAFRKVTPKTALIRVYLFYTHSFSCSNYTASIIFYYESVQIVAKLINSNFFRSKNWHSTWLLRLKSSAMYFLSWVKIKLKEFNSLANFGTTSPLATNIFCLFDNFSSFWWKFPLAVKLLFMRQKKIMTDQRTFPIA